MPSRTVPDRPVRIEENALFYYANADRPDTGLDQIAHELTHAKRQTELERMKQEIGEAEAVKNDHNNPRTETREAERTSESDNNYPREIMDIFGDKDTLLYYKESVREIIETPGCGDRIHDYVSRNKNVGRNYDSLNDDWRKNVLKFTPDPAHAGETAARTNRRIAAASQLLMIDYYQQNVFEVSRSEKMNPWTFADGLTGPYTVSVYGEFWNSAFSHDSPRKKLGRSQPKEISPTFPQAQAYLNSKLRQAPPLPVISRNKNRDTGSYIEENISHLPDVED